MQTFKLNIGQCLIVFQIFLCAAANSEEYDFEELYDTLLARDTPPDVIHKNAEQIVKQMMNFSLDPCDNFYEFSCGNFKNVNKYDNDFFKMLHRKMYQAAKDLLREDDETTIGDSEHSYFWDFSSPDRYDPKSSISQTESKAKIYFQSCIDIEGKKLVGMKPAIEYLKSFVSEPFNTSYSDEELQKWTEITDVLKYFDESPLYKLTSGSEFYQMEIGEFVLNWNFTEETYNSSQQRNENLEYVGKFLENFEVDSQMIPQVSAEIVEFDRMLAEIHLLVNSSNRPKTLLRVRQLLLYPTPYWEHFWREIGLKVRNDHILVHYVVMRNLTYLLESNSQSTISNYLQFRLARNLLNFTSQFEGTEEELEEFCYAPLKKYMNTAFSALALRRFLSKPIQDDIIDMIKVLDQEFVNLVSNSDHLSEDVKEALIEKTRNTSFVLGIVEREELVYRMDRQFESLYVTPDNFVKIAVAMQKFLFEWKQHMSLTYYDVLEVNAFYNPHRSQRRFALGFMLPTSYHINFPKWINYGNFGNTIAHELFHAFDTKEFLYKAGRREKQSFTLSTILRHFKKSLCLARQYNAQGIDGIKSLPDNAADLGGLMIAYEAYKKLLNENEEFAKSEQPQDLDFTPDQLFFVSYAQSYCEKVEEENDRTHAPKRYRAIGSIINLQSFADAFQCPVNSPMNPSKKCSFI